MRGALRVMNGESLVKLYMDLISHISHYDKFKLTNMPVYLKDGTLGKGRL